MGRQRGSAEERLEDLGCCRDDLVPEPVGSLGEGHEVGGHEHAGDAGQGEEGLRHRIVGRHLRREARRPVEGGVDRELEGTRGGGLVHGTTVATNAVLQRAGATTVLVTDAGFEDLIEIGRQDRPSLYDLDATRPIPLVPPDRRVGVAGRARPGGAGDPPADLEPLVAAVAALGPEAVAVSLLYSFEDGARERAVAAALAGRLPNVPISISSEVVAEFREYERLSTTVLNAYLIPVVASYLERLATAVASVGVAGAPSVMRSSGGLTSLESAAALPTPLVFSR